MNKLHFEIDGKKYFIKLPNQRDMNEGDLVYKTKYSEALRYGALTMSEALRIIEERKIFGSEDEIVLRELFIKLHQLGEKLMATEKFMQAADIIFEMERIRTDILRINMRKSNILDNTAEAYADEHRLQFYTVACTCHEDNKQVYKNIDEYLENAGTDLAKTAITKTIHLIANEGKDFRFDWPEYQWRLKNGIIDQNLNPIPESAKKFSEQADKEIAEEVNKKIKSAKRSSKKKGVTSA